MPVTKALLDSRLKELRDQLVQLQANAHAVGGAIQVCESLLIEATLVAEAVSPVEIGD